MSDLTQKHCVPCEGGTPPMEESKVEEMLKEVPGWTRDDKKITREFKFEDFNGSMEFVNKVADIANAEDHHPDIYIFYSLVRLTLWTHVAGGLTENDFIMAAKVNELA
jgi:4a-hydroxytetrahydrobiopterin dehydratase